MTAFLALSAPVRAVFALWALLLCLTNLASAVLAAVRKQVRFSVTALALFAPGYLLWQVIFDLSLFGGTNDAVRLSRTLGAVVWPAWLLVFAGLTWAALVLLRCNLRYDRTSITPGTIKLYLDQIPCGVCCWRENGRVLFSNVCMNRLCLALTDAPLLNGNHFRDAVAGGILTAEGRVWRFSSRTFDFDGECLHELIASDITTEYAKTQALEQDKAELSQLNRELRDYYQSMDEIIRRRELLQARVNIHDEMNRLMLSTTAADRNDTAALDRCFSLWEQNALLLCFEAEETAGPRERLEKLAAAIHLRLHWQEAVPETLTELQRGLFFSCAQEAAVNAVKHAGAGTLTIGFAEAGDGLVCRFTNDGRPPSAAPRLTGGLANLALLANKQGADVSVSTEGPFTLLLRFPKKTAAHQPIG